MKDSRSANIDRETVEGFGEEWSAFDQDDLPDDEQTAVVRGLFLDFSLREAVNAEFGRVRPWLRIGAMGRLVAPRVGKLHCLDPAAKALDVCRRRLAGLDNVEFHEARG